MAETAINDKLPVRIDASGGLFLDDGSTQHDLYALDGSSVELVQGGYESLERKDKGELQPTLEGDERLSTVRFRVKCTAPGTNNLAVIAAGRETSGANAGLKKRFSVYVKLPDAKGATGGVKLSLANCYFETPPTFKGGGADYDYHEFDMRSIEPQWVRTTY